MAAKRTGLSGYWQRLSKRERLVLSLTMMVAVSALIYRFPYAMQMRSVNSLKAGVVTTEKEILYLTAQVADLNRRKLDRSEVTPGWELADQKNAILFLESVSGEARRVGVNLVAVHPSQEVDKQSYTEVTMNLDLKGRYRELAEYFRRLENMSKIVNIRKVRLESCPDSSSVCAAQVEAVTYVTK